MERYYMENYYEVPTKNKKAKSASRRMIKLSVLFFAFCFVIALTPSGLLGAVDFGGFGLFGMFDRYITEDSAVCAVNCASVSAVESAFDNTTDTLIKITGTIDYSHSNSSYSNSELALVSYFKRGDSGLTYTFDLNGNEFTYHNTAAKSCALYASGSTVVFCDNSDDKDGEFEVRGKKYGIWASKVVINSGKTRFYANDGSDSPHSLHAIKCTSTFTSNGGSVYARGGYYNTSNTRVDMPLKAYGIHTGSECSYPGMNGETYTGKRVRNGLFVMNGGSVTCRGAAGVFSDRIEIKGGTLKACGGWWANRYGSSLSEGSCGIYFSDPCDNDGYVLIEGGKVIAQSAVYSATSFFSYQCDYVKIKGGTVYAGFNNFDDSESTEGDKFKFEKYDNGVYDGEFLARSRCGFGFDRGDFIMEGGSLYSYGYYGRGIFCGTKQSEFSKSYGTFTMSGGKIHAFSNATSSETDAEESGDALYIYNVNGGTVMSVSGGNIKATGKESGVHIPKGNVLISGSDGTHYFRSFKASVSSKPTRNGGFLVEGGNVTLSGGSIAAQGGDSGSTNADPSSKCYGIYVSGKLTVSGASVQGRCVDWDDSDLNNVDDDSNAPYGAAVGVDANTISVTGGKLKGVGFNWGIHSRSTSATGISVTGSGSLEGIAVRDESSNGIRTESAVNIETTGTIIATTRSKGSNAFFLDNGNLTISNGTIYAGCPNAAGLNNNTSYGCVGLRTDEGNITIEGGTIYAKGISASKSGDHAMGIRSDAAMSITGGTINARAVTGSSGTGVSRGLYVESGYNMTISNATVNTTAVGAGTLAAYGIQVPSGKLSVSNTTMTATATYNGIYIGASSASNAVVFTSSKVTLQGGQDGINSQTGITISGSNVDVKGTSTGAISGSGTGLWAGSSMAIKIDATSGKVTGIAQKGGSGIATAGAITVTGGADIYAETANGNALRSTGANVTLSTTGTVTLKGTASGASSEKVLSITAGQVNATATATSAIALRGVTGLSITGTSSVSAEAASTSAYAIKCTEGQLTVSGSGTIIANGCQDGMAATKVNISGTKTINTNGTVGCGIYAVNETVISGAVTTAVGPQGGVVGSSVAISGDSTILEATGSNAERGGIHAAAAVTMTGGTVTAKNNGDGGRGVNSGSLTISGGKLNALAEFADPTVEPYATLIRGDISISGGTVTAKAPGNATSGGQGLCTSGGTISVTGGTVYAEAGRNGVRSNGALTISGNANVTGKSVSLPSGSGIFAANNGTITIDTTGNVLGYGNTEANGIGTAGTVTIGSLETTNVYSTHGIVNATGKRGIRGNLGVTIQGSAESGQVTASGTEHGVLGASVTIQGGGAVNATSTVDGYGIYSSSTTITIKQSPVKAVAKGQDDAGAYANTSISISDKAYVEATATAAGGMGIYAESGSVIKDAVVYANGAADGSKVNAGTYEVQANATISSYGNSGHGITASAISIQPHSTVRTKQGGGQDLSVQPKYGSADVYELMIYSSVVADNSGSKNTEPKYSIYTYKANGNAYDAVSYNYVEDKNSNVYDGYYGCYNGPAYNDGDINVYIYVPAGAYTAISRMDGATYKEYFVASYDDNQSQGTGELSFGASPIVGKSVAYNNIDPATDITSPAVITDTRNAIYPTHSLAIEAFVVYTSAAQYNAAAAMGNYTIDGDGAVISTFESGDGDRYMTHTELKAYIESQTSGEYYVVMLKDAWAVSRITVPKGVSITLQAADGATKVFTRAIIEELSDSFLPPLGSGNEYIYTGTYYENGGNEDVFFLVLGDFTIGTNKGMVRFDRTTASSDLTFDEGR